MGAAGSASSTRKFQKGALFWPDTYVKIDATRSSPPNFDGDLRFGKVIGCCESRERRVREYTILIEDGFEMETECVDERFLRNLEFDTPEPFWVSTRSREVAVWVETHPNEKFVGDIIEKTVFQGDHGPDIRFKVKFKADGTIMEKVKVTQMSEPNEIHDIWTASPVHMAADHEWMQDRKIRDADGRHIDDIAPMLARIQDCLRKLRHPRDRNAPPLRFLGKHVAVDSEDYPVHPKPLPDLIVDGEWVDTWGKFAGKVKFATTYKIGPTYPRMDAWVTQVDASEPLYLQAALPVYAGLICLGWFQGRPEWIRASDVALVGIALYLDGEHHACNEEPPLEKNGMKTYNHEACHFIPGCASTYLVDQSWVGASFCLAPMGDDYEVRSDIHNITAFHEILKKGNQRTLERASEGADPDERRQFTVQVDLVLSTSYLANVRQVCCGAVTVHVTDKSMQLAEERYQHVMDVRLESQAAHYPKRTLKVLSEHTQRDTMEEKILESLQSPLVRSLRTSPTSPRSLASPNKRALQSSPTSPTLPPLEDLVAQPELPGAAEEAATAASAGTAASSAQQPSAQVAQGPQPPSLPPPPAGSAADGGSLEPPPLPPSGTAAPAEAAASEGPGPPPLPPPPAASGSQTLPVLQTVSMAAGQSPAETAADAQPGAPSLPPPPAADGMADLPGEPPLASGAPQDSTPVAPQRPASASRRAPQNADEVEPWQVAARQPGSVPPRKGGGRSPSPAGLGMRAPSPGPSGPTAARKRPLMDTAADGRQQPPRAGSRSRPGSASRK